MVIDTVRDLQRGVGPASEASESPSRIVPQERGLTVVPIGLRDVINDVLRPNSSTRAAAELG